MGVGEEVGSLLEGVVVRSEAKEVSVVGGGLVETSMETGGSIQGEGEEEEEKVIEKEEGEVGVPVGSIRMLVPGERWGGGGGGGDRIFWWRILLRKMFFYG